uniref:Serine/threonine protein phosphatase 2A 57 kDa regulatory subunit B' theta isoform-like n=1 Tax=Rhizophora mucronata TaxID=61149 RepID=A0A2P2MTR1_RHIMU
MLLSFKNKAIEDVIDSFPDEWPVDHEFSIDTVQNSFQVLPLSRVLRIKKIQQPKNKRVVNVSLSQFRICLWRLHKPQKKFIYNLQVRPCRVHQGLFLFQIIGCQNFVLAGWRSKCPKQICGHHLDNLLHDSF